VITKLLSKAVLISLILWQVIFLLLPIHIVSGNFIAQPEQPPEGVRINADGMVEGTSNIQRSGKTYTLTASIYDAIVILRDGIVLDGAGYTIQGNGDSSGVFIQGRNDIIIKNLKISNFEYGIKFTWLDYWRPAVDRNNQIIKNIISNNKYGIAFYDHSEGNVISNNYISENSQGIILQQSNNVLRNNRFVDNNVSISDYGIRVNDIDSSNTVNGKPIYYWIDQHDKTVPSDAGWVVLKNCSCITVESLNLEGNGQGILLSNTNGSVINGNYVTNNLHGIVLLTSSNNTISNNNVTKSDGYGIQLNYESNNNSLINNRIWENAWQGIWVDYSNETNISSNLVEANGCGITLEVAKKSKVNRNNITLNKGAGIELSYETCDNLISENYIEKNALGISIGPIFNKLSPGNIITENMIRENNGWAIKIDPAQTKNLIYRNNFIDNNVTEGIQVSNPGQWTYRDQRGQWLPGDPNSWENGVEGNYWSEYKARYPDAVESEMSGVWSIPFYINENNVDNFPLVAPWEIQSVENENEIAVSVESFPSSLAIASFVILGVFGFSFLLNLANRKRAKET
jgi:parallel beta-helix repeat protein